MSIKNHATVFLDLDDLRVLINGMKRVKSGCGRKGPTWRLADALQFEFEELVRDLQENGPVLG